MRERECEGEGDEEEVESKRKKQSFGVESKIFEVGIFLEGLDECVKDGKDEKWEKG